MQPDRTIVGRIISLLKCGQKSRFEYEAPARNGLRSGFCLTGLSWRIADEKASEIVRIALSEIGAARPSWQEGQRSYADTSDASSICRNCGELFSHDAHRFQRHVYCSPECKSSDRRRRERDGERLSKAEYLAKLSLQKSLTQEKMIKGCKHCHRRFLPKHNDQKYCSYECRNKAYEKPKPIFACEECGNLFERKQAPRNKEAGIACSKKCAIRLHHRNKKLKQAA